MKYFNDINSFFEKRFKDNFNNENSPFTNGLEKAIFCLVQDILKKETGAYFVEVPMRELGANDYANNYTSFCGAIAFAAAKCTYEVNKNNSLLEIGNYEYFYDGQIFIRRGDYKLPFDDYGTRNENNTIFPIKTPLKKSKLLSHDKFSYNNQNGTNTIKHFVKWAKTFDSNPNILNNITQKILIISHGEIDKSEWVKKIPHCKITEEGNESYSSPIEPLIYLARAENDKVTKLVEDKMFDTILFIGDAKFYDGGLWALRNNFFKRKIYIGGNNKPDTAENFYCFSPTEIQQYYGAEITDDFFEFIQANFESLQNKLDAFIECLKVNKNDIGAFRLSLLPLLNRTAPIGNEFKEQLLEWFDNKLMSSLSFSDYENISEKLTEAYTYMLDALSNGNESKLKELDIVIKKYGTKNTIIIVKHRDEIDYFRKTYQIDKDSIVLLNSFSKKLKKHAYGNSANKHNVYIFLAYNSNYDDCLQMLDSFSLSGKRIFIGVKDSRFDRMLQERREMINTFFDRHCREEYTCIKFQLEHKNEDLKGAEQLSINDFLFNDDDFLIVNNNHKLVTYTVTLDDDSKVVLSGMVEVENSILDIEDLSVGDTFTYYTPQADVFNTIFNKLYSNLNDEIEQCSKYWISALREIYKQEFKGKINPMYEQLKKYGWKTNDSTLRLYLSDRNFVQFPQSSSLKALKKYCDQINSNDFANCNEYKNHYNEVRSAQKAQSSKNKLGRLISRNLLEEKIGMDKSEFIQSIGEDLWTNLKSNCLKTGSVKEIKKTKD